MPPSVDLQLLTRYLTGFTTSQEKQQVDDWLQASPENQRYMNQLRRVWQASGEIPIEPAPDTDQAWMNLREKMEKIRPLSQPVPVERTIPLYGWMIRVAAILLITVGLSFLYYWSTTGTGIFSPSLTQVQTGEQVRRVVLADGSQVWLNRRSSIRYPKSFNGLNFRDIQLEGEAYFEVVPDSTKPFLVHTGQLVTKVLGTAFVLQAYNSDSLISLQVSHGEVAFYPEATPTGGVRLLANQQAVFSKANARLAKGKLTDPNFLSWKSGRLLFRNTPLSQVAQTLRRHFGKKVLLANPQLNQCLFTGEFNRQTLPEILETLQLTLQVQYSQNEEGIVLEGSGCP